jgi:monothiol glutaredoxin
MLPPVAPLPPNQEPQRTLFTKKGTFDDGPAAPSIAVDAETLLRFRAALTHPEAVIRLAIDDAFEHLVCVDERRESDLELVVSDVTLVLDPKSAARADGMGIEWVTTEAGEGFRICNPNRPHEVRYVDRTFLESEAAAKDQLLVVDARTEEEYQTGHLAEARLLDARLIDALSKLDRAVPLLFYCSNGVRSRRAAEHYQKAGYRTVYCLSGGLVRSS